MNNRTRNTTDPYQLNLSIGNKTFENESISSSRLRRSRADRKDKGKSQSVMYWTQSTEVEDKERHNPLNVSLTTVIENSMSM